MTYPVEFEMWWNSHHKLLQEPIMKDVAFIIWTAARDWV